MNKYREAEVKKSADEVWARISNSYHWGDEFNGAYNGLLESLREYYKKGYLDAWSKFKENHEKSYK